MTGDDLATGIRMNGIEALLMLKEGHTIAHISANGKEIDRYYRFWGAKKHGKSEPKIWFRWANEWIWKESACDVKFWLLSGNDFLIVDDGLIE